MAGPDNRLRTDTALGPDGAGTLIVNHSMTNGTAAIASDVTTGEDLLTIQYVRDGGTFTAGATFFGRAVGLKVYGRTKDDAFSVSDVAADVGASAGLDVANVQANSLAALPLDWLEAHPDLLTYMAELVDWRWLALHDGLHFGPYEKTWDAFSTADATPSLNPEPRFNRVHVPWRTLAGAPRVSIGIPDVDPFPGEERVIEMEELEDPQPDSSLPDAVAAARANYEASTRLTGSLDLARIRYRGEVRSPYDLTAGDLISMPDLGVGPQRVTGVTYRPGGRVTADIGTGFNPVKTLADAERERKPRVRKRKRRRRR